MSKRNVSLASHFFEGVCSFLRRCMFYGLSIGPLPKHIAFIMDGNRRYAKKLNLEEGSGHKVGFAALMNMLKYCYELDIKYVTVYAFSIDNFQRKPEEVQSTMQLIQEKIEAIIEEGSIIHQYGVRMYFIGNLKLLSKSLQFAVQRAMEVTSDYSKAVLSVCIAYTSTDEIVHAVEETCREKWEEYKLLDTNRAGYSLNTSRSNERNGDMSLIELEDIEKNMRMSVVPDPDIIIRTSGETRLSNFLLWQSSSSLLCSPAVLWPEIELRHLVQAILDFQRNYAHSVKKRKPNPINVTDNLNGVTEYL